MSEHVLSILVKAVGTGQATKNLKGVDRAVSNLGSHAGQGLRNAGANIANIGKVMAVGLGAAVAQGVGSLIELENATTQVDGAIKAMGETGQVTSAQVSTWANQIESDIGAAFDDKDITAATANLIRFGNVTPKNLHKAMVVMTDLAAKTGDVGSASSLLGKALADPEKAAGKLARVGIVLTDAQKKQIKAFMEAGKVGKAQGVILDALADKTKGAAAATQGPAARAWATLKDTWEDVTRALAVGFLPVLTKVSEFLKGKLADPAVMDQIKSFGQGLADAFESVLGFAQKIPWDSIATAMKVAGTGAKAALDLFTGLPSWVQTAVLTGWGLNKLTGGAVGSIIKDIGGGLIKGVLGMNAGVVNIKAGVVNGAGGAAGAAGAAGGGAGKFSKALGILGVIGSAAAVFETQQQVSGQSSATAAAVHDTQKVYLQGGPGADAIKNSIAAVDKGIADIQSNPLNVLVQGSALEELQSMKTQLLASLASTEHNAGKNKDDLVLATKDGARKAVEAAHHQAAVIKSVQRAVDADKHASVAATHTASAAVRRVQASVDHDRAATVAAVNRKKLSVKVNTKVSTKVNTYVTAAHVKQSVTHLSRATKSGGTYTSGGYD